jgi:hypothetical protein
MSSSRNWRVYETEARSFFQSLGLVAEVAATVEGARAKHEVDVLVHGSIHGIPFKWVVECKSWKTSVPKEKVLALYSIIQDIGADRGFLLSESGFQSGAIRAAESSNVTLTSLADLALVTGPHIQDAILGSLLWRARKQQDRLRAIKRSRYDDDYYPPTADPQAKLMFLDMSLADANRGEYPVMLLGVDGKNLAAPTLQDLLPLAENVIRYAELWTPPSEA